MPAAARASPLDMAVVSADEASSEPDEAAGRVEVSLAVFIKAKDGLLTRRGRRTVCGARRRGRPAGSRARTGATGDSIRGRADGSRADDASDHGGRLADGPAETVGRPRGRAASCGRPARSCSSSRSGRPGVRGCARSSAPDRAGASGGRSCGAGSGGGRCAGSSRSGLRGKCTRELSSLSPDGVQVRLTEAPPSQAPAAVEAAPAPAPEAAQVLSAAAPLAPGAPAPAVPSAAPEATAVPAASPAPAPAPVPAS